MRSSSSAARLAFALGLALIAALGTGQELAHAGPASSSKSKTAPAPAKHSASASTHTTPAQQGAKAATSPASTTKRAMPAKGTAPANGASPAAANGASPAAAVGASPAANGASGKVPVDIRLRQLEERVEALKERAWRAKARVGILKEAVLGGGIGARAAIVHLNQMGSSFRLIKLVYALDGAQIFARQDNGGNLSRQKSIDILTGPIAPGSHTISVLAVYRGNGYGVFKYLDKYRFTVRSSHTFTAAEGKGTTVKVRAYEKGGVTTPLEKRPAISFRVSVTKEAGKKK